MSVYNRNANITIILTLEENLSRDVFIIWRISFLWGWCIFDEFNDNSAKSTVKKDPKLQRKKYVEVNHWTFHDGKSVAYSTKFSNAPSVQEYSCFIGKVIFLVKPPNRSFVRQNSSGWNIPVSRRRIARYTQCANTLGAACHVSTKALPSLQNPSVARSLVQVRGK